MKFAMSVRPTGGSHETNCNNFHRLCDRAGQSGARVPAHAPGNGKSHRGNAGTGRFNCPPVTKGTQTYTTSYALFDINGTTQSVYNKATTASINFIVADTGATSYSANSNTFSDTTYRLHNRTVSTLIGDTVHTWNGTGTGSVHSSRTGQIAKVYTFASIDTASAIRFRQPRDINPYPLGGTFVKDYTVVRTREASDTTTHSTTRQVVVTFNGTVNVPMTINGTAYTLNLDTHKVTKQ